ncbi:MAG: carboxypeptidase-like regulatory domain-containing protein, partial [Acidobacteriota bacterium]|nr:carboxypeptidase-like regulatory domain-containing protein [Acidobacteriota bacterium]
MRTFRLYFLAIVSAALVFAQGERGSLDGTVTDTSGAAIPGATVRAIHIETNVESTSTTTDSGIYRMPYLPLGSYRITASKAGFKTAIANNVTLRVAQTLSVDLKLEVGNISEQVTVSGEAPPLETGSSEIGRYISKAEFDTWPIIVSDGQRQIQDFIFKALPGTVGGTFQGSINGGQNYSHEILIEGMPLGRMDLQGGSNNEFSPSAEAVGEFKLQTGTIDARYGGGATAVANFAIKSGTNDLHGTGFSFFQNDALRANSFGNNAIGRPRPPLKLFNWGYEFDGPVYIPKIYNGRNKTFWMTNFEKNRLRDFTSLGLSTLPTTDFKRGDFSRLLNPAFTGNANSGSVTGTDAIGRPVV